MRTIKMFLRGNCPRCPQAKLVSEELRSEGYPVVYFDLSTVDGLAEGAFHSVMATPTILLVDKDDRELAEWRGVVPSRDDVKREFCLTV